jgi:DNA-binding MarR family transcriptional regulator
MSHRSDARLLVLHALRLKGVVAPEGAAEAVDLDVAAVTRRLDELAAEGLVVRREGLLSGWQLTPAGRAEHERLLAAEVDAAGARADVERAYRRFRTLNPQVLDACSRWQVKETPGGLVRNDHADPAYDEKVLNDLDDALADGAVPLFRRLPEVLARYGRYGPRLETALDRARAGEGDYVTRPVLPSFHTVWFELHEDLLATLGLDRTAESGEPDP